MQWRQLIIPSAISALLSWCIAVGQYNAQQQADSRKVMASVQERAAILEAGRSADRERQTEIDKRQDSQVSEIGNRMALLQIAVTNMQSDLAAATRQILDAVKRSEK